MQETEERELKSIEPQPEVSEPKENEKMEDVLEHEEGIIITCEDAKEEKEEKTGEDDGEEKLVSQCRRRGGGAYTPTFREGSSQIKQIFKT